MSFMPKTWDVDVVSDYIKQESQQKSPEIFLETHIPIRKIRAEILVGHDDDFVSDKDLLKHVVQSNPEDEENRIYLLKGEVGSGKSHLCQWLEYQINGYGGLSEADEHVAIHISRNSTRLSDILDKLYEHIDAEYDELRDIAELDSGNLSDFIISGLRTFETNRQQFTDFDLEQFLEDNPNGPDLRTVLERNIREYQEAVEDENREQRIELIDREEFGRVCFDFFGKTYSDANVFPKVRNAIHDLVMRNLGIEDFQGELEDIADQYQYEGKRPVLICEDVTTFTVLKDDLMDHVFQLGDGGDAMRSGFDVILGYTTGWETEKADDALMTGDLSYMRQRAEGYLVMTNDDGEAYFLEDGAMPVQLVEKYLEIIKDHSETSLDVAIEDDAFDSLYPFSERFVMRAYKHLEENGTLQQTPRLLLYHVIGDCLRSDVPPHEKVTGHGYLREFSAPTSVGSYGTSFRNLVKWYGRMNNGAVVTPVACFEAFDVDIPDDVEVSNEHVRLEVLYENVGWEISAAELEPVDQLTTSTDIDIEDHDDGTTGSSTQNPSGESSIVPSEGAVESDDEEQSDRARRIEQFRTWFGSGGEFPSSNRLKKGVQAALNRFYDPTRLANENATTTGTAGFYYARGDDIPVEIRGPDASKDQAFTVSHQSSEGAEYETMLYEMMLYGLEDEFRDEANFDTIRAWVDEKVVQFRAEMRGELESVLPDGIGLEEFIVIGRFFILNAAHGASTIERSPLLRNPEEYQISENSPYSRDRSTFDLPASLESTFSEMSKRRSGVADLSRGFFMLKKNFVDHDRLEPAIKSVSENIDEHIVALAGVSASEIPDGYRIGTTRQGANVRAKQLFEVISDYAAELQKLKQSFDSSVIDDEVQTVNRLYNRSHTPEELLEFYNRLHDCIGLMDIPHKERWEKAQSALQQNPENLDIESFGWTLRKFDDAKSENGLDVLSLMHEYHESRDHYDVWIIYKTLAEIVEAIENQDDADVSEFRDIVCSTPEFETVRQSRDSAVELIGEI